MNSLLRPGIGSPQQSSTAIYELSNDEIAEIEDQFGAGVFVNNLAKLRRGYDNKTYFDINVNESVAIQHLVTEAELPEDVRANAAQASTLKELLATLTTSAGKRHEAHKAALVAAALLEEASEKTKATDDANRLKESASANLLRSNISTYLKKRTFKEYVWNTYLWHKVPKFLYFDEYYQMEGQINIQKLNARQAGESLTESDRPMLGLIELARLDIDQLLAAKDTQALLNKIEGASNHLSKQILKYWSQNKHILVRFDPASGAP